MIYDERKEQKINDENEFSVLKSKRPESTGSYLEMSCLIGFKIKVLFCATATYKDTKNGAPGHLLRCKHMKNLEKACTHRILNLCNMQLKCVHRA